MKNFKIKGAFLSILILLTLTLAACGSVKDDVQGKWQDQNNKKIFLDIKNDKIEMIYEFKEDGINKKNVIEGKLLEEKDDYVECKFDGIDEKGKLKLKDDILIADKSKFKKID